jgi:tetratricopeptide (TPR) repeat protein
MSRARIVCVLLAAVTLLVYWPVWNHGFVNFDDGAYVSQNPVVQAGLTWPGVKWAFTTFHSANWHPVTWLSHMLDCELFGLDPGGHHLANVLFHAINAVLLFLFLFRTTQALWPSALAAALFAWHPLRVESVAWAAERKDVLCAFFFLLTLRTYCRYAQKRSKVESREPRAAPGAAALDLRPSTLDYGLALFFFALGLMSKPMLVTLPFVLLLLDYWPLQRVPGFEFGKAQWSRLLLEKGPFLALAAASCVVTFVAQQRAESVLTLQHHPLPFRLENALTSGAAYVLKTLWPVNLAVLYPFPKQIPPAQWATATVLLASITGLIWRARRRQPYLLTGWLWFLGMLVPVIGLVQVGVQAMADRYTYLPHIGLFMAAAFGLADLAARLRLKPAALVPAGGIVLAGCLAATANQLRFWHDGVALFGHAVAVTADNPVARNNLGVVLDLAGRPQEAIGQYQEALRLQPDYVLAHNNLALVLAQTRRAPEAIQHLRETLRLRPDYPEPHFNLGLVLLREGQLDEAVAHFQKALELRPDFNDAREKLNEARVAMRSGSGWTNSSALQVEGGTTEDPTANPSPAGSLLHSGKLDQILASLKSSDGIKSNAAEAHFSLTNSP